MRVTVVITCVLVFSPVFQILALEESRKDVFYERSLKAAPEIKNVTLPEKKMRRPCALRRNCRHENVDNRGPGRSKNKKNQKNEFSKVVSNRGNGFKSPRTQVKSLPHVLRRLRHRDNEFKSLDSVSKNMYEPEMLRNNNKHLEENNEFFNVMQTFFDNESAYNKRFPHRRRNGSKGTWLSGGYNIDSTLELVSTKSSSNTYRDYDDEYQKSLSSVYRDYHNPLRHSLVNLLTELFVSLNNNTVESNFEVASGLANENVEIMEIANDFCQRWIDHKDKLETVFLGMSTRLPSCPCFYPSNIFYNDKIWDKRKQKNFRWRDASGKSQRMDIYKPGAFYCVRSLLTQGSGSAAAQHCCYDQERRLITRGSGAGTPNFVSPEASQVLHEKIDLLPWQLCKGDFSRFNSMRPPNNDNNCQLNPDEDEYQRQKAERKSF